MRRYLNYDDIIYVGPNKESLNQKIERIQYSTALAITGAIKGTFQSKLYNKLGFESLKFRRWFRKLCTFYNIKTTGVPEYLFDFVPETNHITNNTRSSKKLQHFTTGLMYTSVLSFHIQYLNGINHIKIYSNLKL